MTTNKTVVIVGGGYAGIQVLEAFGKQKLKNVNIILISQTNYFYHNVAAPRTLVDESIISKILVPYDKITNDREKKFLHGKVTKIGLQEIVYIPIVNNNEQNEQKLSFDYLILALGSSYEDPYHANVYDLKEQLAKLESLNKRVKDLKRILVVGGGPVGVETAAEFATDHPNKKITLITSSDRLVSYAGKSFSEKTLNILKEKKVEIIFNDSIDLKNIQNFSSQKLKTKNGNEIEFDAYFICYGSKPCTNIISSSFPNWLNETGEIKVNKHFQVLDNVNIFAIGDCCDTKELKLAFNAGFHASVAANNVARLLNGDVRLKEYFVSKRKMMFMSAGRDNGIFQLGFLTVKGFLPTLIKSKTLLIPQFRAIMGYSEQSKSNGFNKIAVGLVIAFVVSSLAYAFNIYKQ